MTELTTAVCSITTTKRKRFFWVAYWTQPPCHSPFRKPDAADGGARSWQEALATAQKAAGWSLQVIDSYWARAFICQLRGQPIPALPKPRPHPRSDERAARTRSAWEVLGLRPGASPTTIRKAFHQRALATHPDQGGDAEQFRAVMRAFEFIVGIRALSTMLSLSSRHHEITYRPRNGGSARTAGQCRHRITLPFQRGGAH